MESNKVVNTPFNVGGELWAHYSSPPLPTIIEGCAENSPSVVCVSDRRFDALKVLRMPIDIHPFLATGSTSSREQKDRAEKLFHGARMRRHDKVISMHSREEQIRIARRQLSSTQ